MPDIFGRPRSMIATSKGTSRPRNKRSSPSPAESTAKPSRLRRAARVSRSGASSSTSNTRMALSYLLIRPDFDHAYLTPRSQDLDAIDTAFADLQRLDAEHLAVRFLLHAIYRLLDIYITCVRGRRE